MADEQAHTLPLFGDDQPEVSEAPSAKGLEAAKEREPLLMIMDGHAMVHRSFRAISTQRHLTVNATGEDVTGVYGFANVFLRALNEWNPAYCAIAFDMSAPTFRHKQFPDYKAQREATPEELRPQFGRVKQLMEAFGVAVYELEGWEADDVIGTLSAQAEKIGLDSVILTGDRDTFQLISPKVRVDLASSIQDRRVYDEAELSERYSGLTASQQTDFKALLGDNSDNIPGVPKVGEKTAIALLNDYQSLEGIYEHIDDVSRPSVRQSLEEFKDRAFSNRDLMTIDRESPVELDLEKARFGDFDRNSVVQLMTELEFFTVIPRIPETGSQVVVDADATPTQAPGEGADYTVVQTKAQLEHMLDTLHEAGRFSFDTETTGLDAVQAGLVGLSFSTSPSVAWYVPVGHQEGEQIPLEEVLAAVRPLFESPDISKCAHNANYDMTILASHGIECQGVDFDTMVAAHLLSRGQLGLKNLALDVLGQEMTPITELIGTGRKQVSFDQVDITVAAPYAAADADMTGRLRLAFEEPVVREAMSSLMTDMEMPLVPVLVTMQRHGIKLDAAALREMSEDLREQMFQTEEELYKSIGHTVNINSPQQLSDLLFNEIGLPKTKRTKTGYSTDANSLEGLKGLHPVVDQILDYRQVSKLKSTYVDALPDMVNPATGRVHTSYNQTGSATGRMSSSDPNLQNIPIRTELGRQVRKAFVADGAPDWLLFSADYSQIELRVLAHISQDPGLLEAFQRGEDIHSSTASLMFEVPLNEVNAEQRRIAKVLNFGVIYGLSPHGISQQTGFSREEGASFIENYFSKYPGINDYLEQVKVKARTDQYVETLLGRRRYLPDINSPNFNVRGGAERMAINMPIQGTAADIMKLAMIKVQNRLDEEGLQTKMLLQVHDELVFETPKEEMSALKDLVFDEMPAAMDLDVTLKVDAKWGQTWGDMQ
ncbi:MAG: DNA polymerase I [Chloroflexota bacterium]|nr:DNA polymerase I [Dehalococcoidia bacterium]MEC8958194.1 DNA polymerase I [Chloroflexota bacterium]MEC9271308.1 DNA polymerase I [Chloroflexota bacterium]MEC9446898.1 DNA polymerase I [Chloroflexota bacterium]MEE3249004.1 DNA polymerase I [Chloroflexota bacterium]|tara:strand:- start:2904 stop:5726 length:2823 start_codon:yes stop_codon:yes gene_type:complete